MTKEQKNQEIAELVELLSNSPIFYLTDTTSMNAAATSNLRRECFKQKVGMRVVKNTLLRKALERIEGKDYSPLFAAMKGNTAVMTAEVANVPARLIKEFRKKHEDRPLLKGAFIQEDCYVGDNQLEALATLKSKEELVGDIIALLQSPAKNVISALKGSAGQKVAGIVKALEERGA
jgi:large subunit ribosomal protein L10